MLTPTCQYALRALVFLDRAEPGIPVLAREIASVEGIPLPFLSKILQSLVHSGFVRSRKGPGGGYVLHRSTGRITVQDVRRAVDAVQRPEQRCLFGQAQCSNENACAVHDAWSSIRSRFEATIGALTIRELAATNRPDL